MCDFLVFYSNFCPQKWVNIPVYNKLYIAPQMHTPRAYCELRTTD